MTLRTTNLQKLRNERFDVLVLGGGINGAVSAAALAAQGATVALVDQGDFAGLTSQSSSNLAWGGIKYLESYEFGLVRKLCRSRNKLIRAYPSTVQEIRFFANLDQGSRFPAWLVYAGTLLYWAMGGGFTRFPHLLSPRQIASEEPIVRTEQSIGGVEYSDAYLRDNDARFVFEFVRDALDRGCVAANYVESLGSRREGEDWQTRLRDVESGAEFTVCSRVLINACGPYVDAQNALSGQRTPHQHLFSKGIHLVVPRLTESRRVLTFFADDGRLFFAIPMGHRTVLGTTDTRTSNPEEGVTPEDRQFVLENINKRLKLPQPLSEQDIIAERCGVRPLVVESGSNGDTGEWTKLSRKHELDVNVSERHISIFGGKLTDCLNVGEDVCQQVEQLGVSLVNSQPRWYGEPPEVVRDEFLAQARGMKLDKLAVSYASEPLSQRLWRRYGTDALAMLEEIREDPHMGEVLIEDSEYLRVEIAHAARRELIVRLEDFLRRRSKIALLVPFEQLRQSQGLREACRVLFDSEADVRWEEYFRKEPVRFCPAGRVSKGASSAETISG